MYYSGEVLIFNGIMLFQESETTELKEVVADDIKKKSLLLRTVMEGNSL